MPTAIAHRPTGAGSFVARAVAWSLGLFGVLRLPWIEAHLVLPVTQIQSALAVALFGTPTLPLEATLACSGADALALCLGAVLGYPATRRARLAGAGGAVALILSLNTIRIGTLGWVAASPRWFTALHVFIWPALLTSAIAGYVFWWMSPPSPAAPELRRRPAAPGAWSQGLRPSGRFVVVTVGFLILFSAASPMYLTSPSVLALASVVAQGAALILGLFGVSAHATATVLWVPRGGFRVTQECIATPLIPIYLAAICTSALAWRWRILGALATLPLFVALGIVRLLVVALPDVGPSPLLLVHAFYQLLLGAVVVFLAALWRHGRRTALHYTVLGLAAGSLVAWLVGPWLAHAVTVAVGAPGEDPQGAIAFLPAFQVGLYLALWVATFLAVGWSRFLIGLGLLGITQIAGGLALHVANHAGLTTHVRDVRGWAVAGPVLVLAAVVSIGRTRR